MERLTEYDVGIIGGGLAGLAASILLAKDGYSVAVFEKEAYPFHKVCGEYVSMESWNFLESLGLRLQDLNLPLIDTLHLTAPNGKEFITKLPLGGFGISRYKLDSSLAKIAVETGVHLFTNTKVTDVSFKQRHEIYFGDEMITAKACCAAYGKRSNLDLKWDRRFFKEQSHRLNNYVGIKYHVTTDREANVIGLHNFYNGYCGISKIEDDKYCLCYMTKAENLKSNNNSIKEMEHRILFQNPHLKKIFLHSKPIQGFPVTISQISFTQKSKVEKGVLVLGDAAGMITPLCGNGMSIALHTAKIASFLIIEYLQGATAHSVLGKKYEQLWSKHFGGRLRTGRMLQAFFGSNSLSNFFVGTFKTLPFLARPVIKLTHGQPF